MRERLYTYRFELFLSTQLIILFGSLFLPLDWFEHWLMPLFLLVNILTGILLVSKKMRLGKFLFFILALSLFVFIANAVESESSLTLDFVKLGAYFTFYSVVTVEIIKQVWKAKIVGKNVILGLISGYISLGLLAFFMCLTIDIVFPNSFSGIDPNVDRTEQLMYYAYITLMTIGYGDILPVRPMAQKAAVFIGLIGQFYLVILTATVVGKYINQNAQK